MSAYMVDKEHVDILLAVGLRGVQGRAISPDNAWHGVRWFHTDPQLVNWQDLASITLDFTNVDEVGSMLVQANLDSIHARYPDTLDDPENTPGPLERYWDEPYRWTNHRYLPTAVEALKAISGYEYQACEHDGWRASEAYQFCQALRLAVINHLPGIEDAPWTWDAGDIANRQGVKAR